MPFQSSHTVTALSVLTRGPCHPWLPSGTVNVWGTEDLFTTAVLDDKEQYTDGSIVSQLSLKIFQHQSHCHWCAVLNRLPRHLKRSTRSTTPVGLFPAQRGRHDISLCNSVQNWWCYQHQRTGCRSQRILMGRMKRFIKSFKRTFLNAAIFLKAITRHYSSAVLICIEVVKWYSTYRHMGVLHSKQEWGVCSTHKD